MLEESPEEVRKRKFKEVLNSMWLNKQVRKSLPPGWSAKRIDLPGMPPTYEVRISRGEFIGFLQVDNQFPLKTHWQEQAKEEEIKPAMGPSKLAEAINSMYIAIKPPKRKWEFRKLGVFRIPWFSYVCPKCGAPIQKLEGRKELEGNVVEVSSLQICVARCGYLRHHVETIDWRFAITS